MTTQQFLTSAWTWNSAVFVFSGVALAGYLYAFGLNRRIAFLIAGLGLFMLTLVSPLNALANGYLFSAHMLQHIFLLLIVPALLLMSVPRWVSLGAPAAGGMTNADERCSHGPAARLHSWHTEHSNAPPRRRYNVQEPGSKLLVNPLVGWIAGVGAMWLWHARPLCNAAVSSSFISALQTCSLLLLGAIFWRQILAPREEERLSPPGAVLYLFSACVACSILGILITFAPVSVCPIYTQRAADELGIARLVQLNWGFTSDKDQQVGGLLMWVPMCLVYLTAIVVQFARWFAQPITSSDNRQTL
jgi:cytochrome c oxidase assembly factor CtaG